MATLASLVVNLRADTAQYQSKMGVASKTLGSFRGAVARAAVVFGAGFGLAKAARFIVNTNREFERLNAQLMTVTGSATAAAQAFDFLEKFAAETPFQVEENVEAFIRLRALGIRPTIDMMRDFGNIASGMGRRITDFARAVQGAVTGETEALKSFGIVSKIQGDEISFTFDGVTKTVQRNSTAIVNALQEISQANFAGAMANEMDTLNGIISNTKDAFGTIARTLGEVLRPVLADILGNFRDMATNLSENHTAILRFGTIFVEVMKTIASAVVNAFQIIGGLLGNLGALLVGIATFDFGLIKTAVIDMKDVVVANVSDIIERFKGFSDALKQLPEDVKAGASEIPAALIPPVNDAIIQTQSLLEQGGITAGRSFVRGLISGVDDMSAFLRNIINQLAEDLIIGTLEKALGISSPSRVAARIGRQTIAGYVMGLREASRAIPGAVGVGFGLPVSPVVGGGGGTTAPIIINQEINLNLAAVDGASAAAFLRTQKGTLAELMGEAAQESPGFARMIRGR